MSTPEIHKIFLSSGLAADDPGGGLGHEVVFGVELGHRDLDSLHLADAVGLEEGGQGGGAAEVQGVHHKLHVVVQAQQASVSMLQRRFRIGYNRAARIVDMMEERQIVGPQDGSRPRQVLITEEDLMEMKESTEDLEI